MKPKKNKVGRPPLTDRDQLRDRLVTFRLTSVEEESLRRYCWRYELTEAESIRECLRIMGVIPDRF